MTTVERGPCSTRRRTPSIDRSSPSCPNAFMPAWPAIKTEAAASRSPSAMHRLPDHRRDPTWEKTREKRIGVLGLRAGRRGPPGSFRWEPTFCTEGPPWSRRLPPDRAARPVRDRKRNMPRAIREASADRSHLQEHDISVRLGAIDVMTRWARPPYATNLSHSRGMRVPLSFPAMPRRSLVRLY